MDTFFAGLIMVGISLILISIIMVLWDRKKDAEEKREYISVKNKLEELLEDSGEMVDELNRFSDFILSKIDKKCSDYMSLINSVPEKKSETLDIQETVKKTVSEKDMAVNTSKPVKIASDIQEINTVNEAVIFTEQLEAAATSPEEGNKGIANKHSEVIKLFDAGMSDAEIAKALHIGKGEVQLIVGLNLHKIKV